MREHGVQSAIILAAGNGHRMGHLTMDRPKCLLEVGGETLVERQLASLDACGIRDVTVVIGYHGARLRAQLGDRVRYVENARYRETNSLYSLWLARERLSNGALVLNADVLAPTRLIERLLHSRGDDAVLIDRRTGLGPEEMKVQLWTAMRPQTRISYSLPVRIAVLGARSAPSRHCQPAKGEAPHAMGYQGRALGWFDFVVDFSKELPPDRADGENVGIAKFGAEGGRRLIQHLESLVAAGHEQGWAPLAFRALASRWPLRAVTTDGAPWIELDFPEDLDRARRVIEPAIRAFDSRRSAA
ncbi:MAG: phosphocholine cytidylyltransferase family protein [Acidobacteria bacterium]|nr:phosphocholine cytidylyltransferase family protein [Acidobacteriota bacterium]